MKARKERNSLLYERRGIGGWIGKIVEGKISRRAGSRVDHIREVEAATPGIEPV